MPLLATFLGSLINALFEFFAKFLSTKLALKLSAYTAYIAVTGTFVALVIVCLNSLWQSAHNFGGGAGWVGKFLMGMGMFIPANAGAVMSCIGSVWIACQVYKMQKQGLLTFGA